jgi:hypothetical protein
VSGTAATYTYGKGSTVVASGNLSGLGNSFKIKLPADSITDIVVPMGQH